MSSNRCSRWYVPYEGDEAAYKGLKGLYVVLTKTVSFSDRGTTVTRDDVVIEEDGASYPIPYHFLFVARQYARGVAGITRNTSIR